MKTDQTRYSNPSTMPPNSRAVAHLRPRSLGPLQGMTESWAVKFCMIEVCERKDFTWFTTPFQGVSGAKMFCDVNDDAPSVSVVAVLSTYGYTDDRDDRPTRERAFCFAISRLYPSISQPMMYFGSELCDLMSLTFDLLGLLSSQYMATYRKMYPPRLIIISPFLYQRGIYFVMWVLKPLFLTYDLNISPQAICYMGNIFCFCVLNFAATLCARKRNALKISGIGLRILARWSGIGV